MNKFQQRICDIRKDKGVSQYRLAKNLGVNRSAVSKWESGDSLPRSYMLIKIANYFGVSVYYLLGMSDD